MTSSLAAQQQAAIAALTVPELAAVVDLVAVPEGPRGRPHAVRVHAHRGAVRLTADGVHQLLHGQDPVARTDPYAFLPHPLEVADPSPDGTRNSYPEPGRRLLSFFSDPSRSPDLVIVHTPRHHYPEQGGHLGEHGSLDVVQSRAPFLLAGAGVRPTGTVRDHARVVDVAPTLLHAAGVGPEHHRDADGLELDGRARGDLVTAGVRRVVGLLWDGAHCSDLLELAAAGQLPAVAALLARGVALEGGAVAEFPSVTLCNHTSALTGVGPGRHGVLGNVFYDRQTGSREVPNDASTWHRSAQWLRPGVRTVFEMLSAADPGATSASVDEAIDRGATYSTMARIRAAGAGSDAGLDAVLPPAADSPYLGRREHLQDDYYAWATRVDDAGLQQVLGLWADPSSAPRLTWWASVVTDAGHHAGGPRSAIARDSLRDSDRRLSVFLAALRRTGQLEQATFLLTADHGFETTDPAVRGSWAPALHAALPAGSWRDEGPGLLYLDLPG